MASQWSLESAISLVSRICCSSAFLNKYTKNKGQEGHKVHPTHQNCQISLAGTTDHVRHETFVSRGIKDCEMFLVCFKVRSTNFHCFPFVSLCKEGKSKDLTLYSAKSKIELIVTLLSPPKDKLLKCKIMGLEIVPRCTDKK